MKKILIDWEYCAQKDQAQKVKLKKRETRAVLMWFLEDFNHPIIHFNEEREGKSHQSCRVTNGITMLTASLCVTYNCSKRSYNLSQ